MYPRVLSGSILTIAIATGMSAYAACWSPAWGRGGFSVQQPSDGQRDPQKQPPKERRPSAARKANRNWHRGVGPDEIRLSWFLDGNDHVAMICQVKLSRAEAFYARDVYDWAVQASHTKKLTPDQVAQVRKVAASLPASDPHGDLTVSVRVDGQPVLRLYSRANLPQEIRLIYAMTGAPLGAGNGG